MTTVVSQPEDWTEPGAHPVVRGVHRIPLPLPIDGLPAVNAYLLEAYEGLILIDPGWASPHTERAVGAALRQLGYDLADIAICLATHHHADHYTQAYAWRDTLGCKLFTGREERHSIDAFDVAGRFPNQPLARRGAAEATPRYAWDTGPTEWDELPFGSPDGWLDNGAVIPLRRGALEVIATPGHTRGHVVFHHPETRILFSGDHILPQITPSLGVEQAPEPYPLRSYLESLHLISGLPDTALLPAHGPVTCSSHARVDALLDHHRRRLDEVFEQVGAGVTSAHDIAAVLPWTHHRLRLTELLPEHQLFAVMEIEAHLDVLSLQGRIHDDRATARRYAPAA
ncbi:MBL fold metallo-hydrolase [Nocardia stercoris]|uniref:MBL fold metallo-hydrolase n=1 Tax=Nocardia stercoris TaxID=2483361 RepID=A0A3M2KT16_9NOCA|nr:MBL fold metallo-hydrolase [Nocardia stercoris]RMI28802.1 MBL fold metallo-hydrolase [Nocardia stercoris]